MKAALRLTLALVSLSMSFVAKAEPGFNPITDKSTPSSVVEASKYLYEFWGPGDVQQVDRKTYLQLANKITAIKSKNFREKMAFMVAKAEVQRCKKLDLPICSVSSVPARGSAFLVSGGLLATVVHNFLTDSALLKYFGNLRQKWNSDLASDDTGVRDIALTQVKHFTQNPLEDSIFFVTDKNENIVFSSLDGKYAFVRWRSISKPIAKVDLSCDEKNNCSVGDIRIDSYSVNNPPLMISPATLVDDIALIKIDSSAGIQVSQQNCLPGQKNYIVGYPAKTKNRKALGFKDAADRMLVYTEGVVVETSDLKKLSEWSGIDNLISFYSDKSILLTDGDGWPGMSGGAILNDQGQACAVFNGSAPYSGELTVNPISKRFNLYSSGVPFSH